MTRCQCRKNTTDFILVCNTPVEREQAVKIFSAKQCDCCTERRFYHARVNAKNENRYSVLIVESADQGGASVDGITKDALYHCNKVGNVINIGTNGGFFCRGINPGTAIIVTKAYNYEMIKLIDGKKINKAVPLIPSRVLLDQINSAVNDRHLRDKMVLPSGHTHEQKIVFKDIASGNINFSDNKSPLLSELLENFPTVVAVDMESYYFLKTMSEHFEHIPHAVIRVSSDCPDLAGGQLCRDYWRQSAAYNAALIAHTIIRNYRGISSKNNPIKLIKRKLKKKPHLQWKPRLQKWLKIGFRVIKEHKPEIELGTLACFVIMHFLGH